jgi:hypothetical protein
MAVSNIKSKLLLVSPYKSVLILFPQLD